MSFRDELVSRAQQYAHKNALVLGQELGFGVHGIVFVTNSQDERGPSALKIHYQEEAYFRERDVYLRLEENGIREIRGCTVPQLLQFDDDLLAIDISIVKRPYLLDFGGAYLDHAPDFSDEVMADWHAEKLEQFGDAWPEVQAILRIMETYGIFIIDVNPNNIAVKPRA